ncbi:MAG: carbamoyl-phosphate synthase large subunit [Bacteroidetes bacterium]|nr:carbamoyl-phosphate synthase large subunit [Rhodothermia bacterium]MCS7154676.1 carbamoyl-phosphate synthase large subunit [Bacteroidota bacterium]MCX7906393.1 carbamoyl-phosphate synthase large subunit [Bacteroidota bacterium]MDW8137469.1 carbamoyl-phosphate synthase large subunit [Bacteroidota bacterium]MDW8285577.1 carbamoyl-phosphate synthase large subunit [Bacteroidota bacterium]
MPKRDDIQKVLIIGSGPIIIGQACEFDYSGTQACRALRAEGIEVVLINSNPATIMTDPMMADRVYLRPLTAENVREVALLERPDAVLPTMGGQTALNLAVELENEGFWREQGIEIIGADINAIRITEDRQAFRDLMLRIGIDIPRSRLARSLLEAKEIAEEIGFPLVIRPSFTLGGTGAGIVWTREEFERKVLRGLQMSPVHEVLIEECIYGWKEFELELLRDRNDNVIIVCPIENVDPMGIHTGDSVTVAPAQTLTDRMYQRMRDMAIRMMRAIGNFAGGCNVQFAVDPKTERMVAIEINPRVSRSSALASKATGYPIAKVAARLAIGYTLDELPNDVTGTTSACFEPAIDYVVVKIPRWNFDKFPGADEELGMQMKAVGEVMAIGRTFAEALQKAWQSLEVGRAGLGMDGRDVLDPKLLRQRLRRPYWDRLLQIRNAFALGASVEEVWDITRIDPWFLHQIRYLVELEREARRHSLRTLPRDLLLELKQAGFSDAQIAYLLQDRPSEEAVRQLRLSMGLRPVFKLVDTCAAEFPAETPYYYSTYEREDAWGNPPENESIRTERPKVVILGSGPNRIGQGIEFDYSCVHGVLAARDEGYEAIMINCNPETVSTDFDVADKLYFEPLYWERVWDILEHERPIGVIVQLGGQTALKLAQKLHEHGIPILGTRFESLDLAEDRGKFSALLKELGIPYPPYGVAHSVAEAIEVAHQIGYPVLVRPSYVLGGQGMRIAVNDEELAAYVQRIYEMLPDNVLLIDRFLENGIEVDVDALFDGEELYIGGIMQHIEPAGVHSGDSTAVLPPFSLSEEVQAVIRDYTERIARRLAVVGAINVQFVVQGQTVYVIEANPRASRTVPFVAKATGVPLADIATRLMLGRKLREFRHLLVPRLDGYAIKEPVFSFEKFPEVERELGPEMKSTGEAIVFVRDLKDEHFQRPYKIRSLYLSR